MRPDGAVVVAGGVVGAHVRGERAHAPPGEHLVREQPLGDRAGLVVVDDAAPEAVTHVGRARVDRALLRVERDREPPLTRRERHRRAAWELTKQAAAAARSAGAGACVAGRLVQAQARHAARHAASGDRAIMATPWCPGDSRRNRARAPLPRAASPPGRAGRSCRSHL